MTQIKSEFTCPKCKKKNRFKYNEIVPVNKVKDIYNKNIIKHKCKYCKEEIMVDQPLLIDTDTYKIVYINGCTEVTKDKVDKPTRLCDTYDDFKEKVLIFEDGLNDLVIELIKGMLIYKLDEDVRRSIVDIRFDSKSDDKLKFFLIGFGKGIEFPLSVYNDMLKRSKIKKIKTMIHVDINNYNKYIKLK